MAFNYTNLGNQSLQNMLPYFGTLPNGGTTMPNHPNFINQLAAAITSATVIGPVSNAPTHSSNTSTTTIATKRESTPEPPPAPVLSTYSPTQKIKPNQGTAPMDLENDLEAELPQTTTTTNSGTITTSVANATVSDPNLFLNNLMPANMNAAAASSYMFFPSMSATANSTATPAPGSMLMDHTAMMAAAIQQMQQGYSGYSMPDAGVDTGAQLTTGAEPYATSTMKEVIKTKSCILFPPNPNAPPPTIRERPPGCRTIFVGGLPENISEEIIREIFESCGEITTLRMSKKNFCHIRYRHEVSIDRAIYLSGYRVRISNTNEPANFGRLHVDYAQARDDQYDYECKQRQLQREQRHRERMSNDRLRSQSPPPMPHYSDHEASAAAENLRNNDTFVKAVQTIAVWLERGDCTKRNANTFYSMIQSTHAHVRRLYNEKQQLEEDLRKARESYRKQMLTMSTQ